MLILTRKIGEAIHIGEDVSIMILTISSGQVRIGIKAPLSCVVNREEISRRIKAGQETLTTAGSSATVAS